ncbi:D-alanine--D-alanine ligase family protein [Phyllobacterium endophyticum]|uniref:D-alanine--D-alanine ligase n=1 Tax=Phyllobacterium endophyticum TaxID=1149773 RepID=A0A2P7ARV3_9HYPH|nr:D-alanine--D-alanine ligase [Phyllobacterium endophyticum]MBB3236579.1 D-alanine-D-alanine ligase [Phyllobacterium endophyticum]PSH56900.1 D-alanine--D-alanine ligase [Phyllobacterium endophyticum]TYR39578.1 D-alanine--D-alanine ligase [Phyllobacterium endophyticum]
MNIGITFDLKDDYAKDGYTEEEIAEFDRPETIEAIEYALHSLGHSTQRIGTSRALAMRLSKGDRWDLVFNSAEGMYGFGRQALAPALLDAYEVPYIFADPLCLAVTLHKATAKRIVRDSGIRTPDFAVVETIADVEKIVLPFPLFVKPVAEGTSKGISAAAKIHDRRELQSRCEMLLSRYRQPVLVEIYLPGREFTVGVLGTGSAAYVLGTMEIILKDGPDPGIYSYDNKKHFDERVAPRLVDDATSRAAAGIALAAWKCLGARDGGRIDVRCDDAGEVNFIEANPLAGMHPRDSDLPLIARMTGVSYASLIERIVASASTRFSR